MAEIALLPKPGKDPNLCSSFRPIALLITDLKLYTKILAKRLSTHLPGLIEPDQVGFIHQRQGADNVRRVAHLVGKARHWNIPACLLSLDAEKAFNQVDWRFLRAVLQKIGLGPQMIARIMAPYIAPLARVRVNGQLTQPIPILRGTWQGCPLSPLLFALVIEPLAILIRQTPDIHTYIYH